MRKIYTTAIFIFFSCFYIFSNSITGIVKNDFYCPISNVNILDADSNIIAITDTLGFFLIELKEDSGTLILRKYGYLDTVINVSDSTNNEIFQLSFDESCNSLLNASDFQLISDRLKPDTLTFILNDKKYKSITTYYTYKQLILVNGYEIADFNCCSYDLEKINQEKSASISYVKSEYAKRLVDNESAEICLIYFDIDSILKIYTSR